MRRIRFRYILIIGVLLCILGTFCGAFFAFPQPDLPPEDQARARLHTVIWQWSFLGGVTLTQVALAGEIARTLNKRLDSPLGKVSWGIALLFSGWLYGAFFALPLPNPPPPGMLWVAHIFVSVTLLLTGSVLLLAGIVSKLSTRRLHHQAIQ